MKHFVAKPAWAFLLMAAVFAGSSNAAARSYGAGDSSTASKAGKKTNSKTGQVSQIKFLPGSEETPKERNSRLKRECKGRVNAGACAGYTH